MSQAQKTAQTAMELHIGIAETGKIMALQGKHTDALTHYREALRLAVAMKAPEVFFRHYTQCTLESLEHTGSYDDIIGFCQGAIEHYQKIGTDTSITRRDHSSHLERMGLILLKSGDTDQAAEKLAAALEMGEPANLPVATTVLGWLRRGITADARRITEVQKKHNYFTVRPDQVDATRARPMPTRAAPSRTASQMQR